MSGLELTEIYRDLKRDGHGVPGNSPLITSCESELAELIRQIDIMFKSKKNEWQREKATLELKVETRAREVQLHQESIDRKNQEIARLREQNSQVERNDKQLISDYQLQVEQLHKDLTTLKKQYEKMRHKHQKEKVRLTAEKFELESSVMSKDKKQLQYEVDRLLSTVKQLTEKCDLMEQQGSTYQDQLAKRKQMIGDIESNLRSEMSSLRCQLHEAEDRESERNVDIARLKADLNHWKNKTTKQAKELQSSEDSLKKANSQVESLQSQNRDLSSELKSQGSNLHLATRGQLCQEKELVRLRDIILEKDKTIRTMMEDNHQGESEAIEILKQDLFKLDNEYRDLKTREIELRTEISQVKAECSGLNKRVKNTDSECLQLRDQLHLKEKEVRETEDRRLRERDDNLNELQSKMFTLKEDHDEEVIALKNELQMCRAQLCEAQASRNNQSCLMTTYTTEDSRLDTASAALNESQANADLRLTKQQLEALRLENQHLKDQVLETQQTSTDVRKAQKHMTEMQTTYDNTVERLQKDNERLRSDMDTLRDHMTRSDESHHHKYRKLLKDMQEDIERREHRILEEHALDNSRLQNTHDAQQEARHALYDQELSALQAQKSMLMGQLSQAQSEVDQTQETNHTLAHENKMMSSFAGNISEVMAMASSSRRDMNYSRSEPYNSAYDDQTTDFMTFGQRSPDPVRRLVDQDTTRDTTLRNSVDEKERRRRSVNRTRSPASKSDKSPASRSHRSNRSRRSDKSDKSDRSERDRPAHRSPHQRSSEHQRSTSTPVKQDTPTHRKQDTPTHRKQDTPPRRRSSSASRIPVPQQSTSVNMSVANKSNVSNRSNQSETLSTGHRSTHSSPAQSQRTKSNRSSPASGPSAKDGGRLSISNRRSSSPQRSQGGRSSSPLSGRSLGVTSSGRLSSINSNAPFNESLHTSSTGSMVAERFLEDQRQRTTALESLLDQHIQGLREDSRQLLSETDQYLNSFT